MEAYFDVLSQCPLFAGITQREITDALRCLDGKIIGVPKENPVFLEGEPARFVGVVLSGAVQVVRDDYYGNRSVLTVVSPGGLFAEVFACAGLETLPVSAIALQPSTVLFLDCQRILTGCSHKNIAVGDYHRIDGWGKMVLLYKQIVLCVVNGTVNITPDKGFKVRFKTAAAVQLGMNDGLIK